MRPAARTAAAYASGTAAGILLVCWSVLTMPPREHTLLQIFGGGAVVVGLCLFITYQLLELSSLQETGATEEPEPALLPAGSTAGPE